MDVKERGLWSARIGLVLVGFATAVVIILLVRLTDLRAEPWAYIGLVIGVLTALAGGALAFIRARELS